MANLPAPEIPEGHYSRFSSGDWAPHPEEKLRELAFLMRDSKAKRAARKRTLAMPSGYVISVSLSIPETIKTRAVSPTLA